MEKAHEFLAFCLDEACRSHAAFAPAHADDGDARARQTVA
jgi:hypothetical protein